eukprot:TRINITY_DN30686_c0_g1_i1.p2 TRINITY_DN30686_c0_g1~~TRINITY_DN30686_c0_g1_i1.p2  ORF type:complete len:489 (+),score=235.10 TRINITY_DN30686_c0_g1_i1:44-1510(+)
MADGKEMTDADKAIEFKEEGNKYFKKGKWSHAIEMYSQAIELDELPAYLCNRAFAHIKNDCAGSAMIDAERSIEIDPTFVKAYYRHATAKVMLGKVKEALKDYKRVLAVKPNDTDAQKKYKDCEKEVKRQQFMAAIKTEEKESLCSKYRDDGDCSWKMINVPASYSGPNLPDTITLEYVEALREHMRQEKMPPKRDVYGLLIQARNILASFPNVVPVTAPSTAKVNVCGDVHGQYYDLLHLFKLGGAPGPDNYYIFNGDFVDRGSYSVECYMLLIAYKILYPNYFFLSRGNHEGRSLNTVYGFEGEVSAKLGGGAELFDLYQECFQALPLSHNLNGKVWCVHGGLYERDGVTIADINKETRFCEPDSGLMSNMLWSDPMPMRGRAPNKRGVGVSFGPDVTEEFLNTNGLEYMIRSHEVKDEGYVVEHDGKCITVFSAPNYCDSVGNKAAFITLRPPDYTPKYTVFDSQPHPGKKAMAFSRMLGGMGGF